MMKIDYSPYRLALVIEDMDRALWLDGRKIYYATPKDYRPDIYNVQDIEDAMQTYYMLSNIGSESEELANLKILGEIYIQYADHVLGKIINEQYGKENLDPTHTKRIDTINKARRVDSTTRTRYGHSIYENPELLATKGETE